MMNRIKKIITLVLAVFLSGAAYSQNGKTTMADTMRSDGRIYVVVAVVVTILLGLILYVYRLDRKITRLEKE